MKIKTLVKSKLLKPAFNMIYRLCPSGACLIRQLIYEGWNYIKQKDLKEQIDTIEILVDSTSTYNALITTGIQRVVKNILFNVDEKIVIGINNGTGYQTSYEFFCRLKNYKYLGAEYNVNFKKVRKFILLDASWESSSSFERFLNQMNDKKSQSYSVVYDLLPIKYKDFFDSQYFVDGFTKWHNMILSKTDHVMCISRAVADDVIEYYSTAKIKRDKSLAVYYFPLGADLPTVKDIPNERIRNKIKNFVSENTFLMVGTIEPRKGHLVALEAVTKRLDAGDDIKLLIIGRNGWKNEEFINLLNENQYHGKNILWLDDANDIELAWCYQHACCLIAASKDEGYGLPLVEAAHYGVPIICSDIPVFREVAQGYADYFKVWDSGALADTIKQWLNSDEHPDSKNIKIYSWAEATKIFMEIVNGEREPYKIIQ